MSLHPTTTKRRAAYRRGHLAETIAAALLLAKGYRVLARRYAANGGELDLVVSRGRVVAFVEVKSRPSLDAAREAIGAQKQRRFGRAMRHWLARNGWAADRILRCDAVFIAPLCWPCHLPDAFTLPD
jgi:putative endonuclease